MTTPSSGQTRSDFFIVHAHPDRERAVELRGSLRRRRHTAFLDRDELTPGDLWPVELKRHLSRSDIIVVMVSPNIGAAHYAQEEVALAIDVARRDAFKHAVVRVMLVGSTAEHIPYGLRIVHWIDEGPQGMRAVAAALVKAKQRRTTRTPARALGGAAAALDEVWSRAEAPWTLRANRDYRDYKLRFLPDGDDLVAMQREHELQRITHDDFDERLSAEQHEYIETLEKSMEVNRALWKRAYPRRVLSTKQRAQSEAALRAMKEDLDGVLDALEDAGFWLDDHYQFVRGVLRELPSA